MLLDPPPPRLLFNPSRPPTPGRRGPALVRPDHRSPRSRRASACHTGAARSDQDVDDEVGDVVEDVRGVDARLCWAAHSSWRLLVGTAGGGGGGGGVYEGVGSRTIRRVRAAGPTRRRPSPTPRGTPTGPSQTTRPAPPPTRPAAVALRVAPDRYGPGRGGDDSGTGGLGSVGT